MKLSRLFKIGAVALMVTSLCFTGCKEEEDDDEGGAISGSNNNYTLSYDNSTNADFYRAYKTTLNKHRGALCQITFKKDADLNGAAMGYIWDLGTTDTSASAEEVARAVSEKPRNFCIVGFNYNNTATNKVAYYVSRYTNVYDIQASNFGTNGVVVNGETETAVEKEYIKLNSTHSFTPTLDENGNVVVTVNVYEETDTNSENKTVYTGSYIVDIYDGAVTKADIEAGNTDLFIDTTTIPASDLGYTPETVSTSHAAEQKQGAVYANVYAGKKASGTWKYADTYSADEVVEE